MEAAKTPLDLAHRVRVPTRSCHLDEQRLALKDAFGQATRTNRRVFALGVNRHGRRVFCSLPEHDHEGLPSVIPWVVELEMQLNGWRRPTRVVELPFYGLYDYPVAVAVGWHPAVWLPEWWS